MQGVYTFAHFSYATYMRQCRNVNGGYFGIAGVQISFVGRVADF
jgi:hypothetical protein